MINYIKELIEVCKLPFDEVVNEYKIIQIGSKMIWVSNFFKIIDYSNERVVLKVRSGLLELKGESLKIQQLNKNEILLKGKVYSCSLEKNNGKYV